MLSLRRWRKFKANRVDRDAPDPIALYERAIREDGNVEAMVRLGALLVQPQDAVRAKELYERAIDDGGNVKAMCNLGALLEQGAEGVPSDAERAATLYHRAIEEGRNVEAMVRLGALFERGTDGVGPDAVRAKGLYELAIKEGNHVGAMFNLGVLLQNGAEGVSQDARRATKLYEKAIEYHEDVKAMLNLGFLFQQGAEGVERDAARSKELYERAIREAGSGSAICKLGILLEQGAEGLLQNPVLAKECYERAIKEHGNVDAMLRLGALLGQGAKGVQRDVLRATKLYERVIVEDGNVNRMFHLGVLFEQGAKDVRQDAVRAKSLYERVIEDGKHVEAMLRLARLLARGAAGVERDAPRAVCLYEQAIAGKGNADAMFQLGILLRDGADGVVKDTKRAKELFERAAMEAGHVGPIANLGSLPADGAEGVERDIPRTVTQHELAISEDEDVAAMVSLANLLVLGTGSVKQDLPRAVALYERAITEGEHRDAMVNLALLLQVGGDGVERDLKRAADLFALVTRHDRNMDFRTGHGRHLRPVEHNDAFRTAVLRKLKGGEGIHHTAKEDFSGTPVALGGVHMHFNSNPDPHAKDQRLDKREAPFFYEIRHLIQQSISAMQEPQSDDAKLRKLELQDARLRANQDKRVTEHIKCIADSVAPFFVGWKLRLVLAVTGWTKGSEIELDDCDKAYAITKRSFPSNLTKQEEEVCGRVEKLLRTLGMSEMEDFAEADLSEIRTLFSQLKTRTTWEDFEQLDDSAAIAYADFHQVLDGVIAREITNCLLDCEEKPGFPTYAISVNVEGCPVRLGVRFMGADAYVDFKGYVRRIASFESKTGSDIALLHVDGPWLVGKGVVRGTVHDVGPVQVAGPRSLTKVAGEMCGKNSSPSRKTIASWRKEFALILSTSDLWFSWRKVHTKCEVLRCKNGRMVVTTSYLTFTRTLGTSITMEPGLELAQEETVTDPTDREVCFDEVVALIGAKVVPEVLENTADDEIARALYISSSWFSTMGPKARPGIGCAWGNTLIDRPEAEMVDWLPTTREIVMAGWKLVPTAMTPTGRNWGPLQTGQRSRRTEEDEFGRAKCHLAPKQCIGPVDSDHVSLEHCVWGGRVNR